MPAFHEFLLGTIKGGAQLQVQGLFLEHSCFIVNGTKGPLAGYLDVPRSAPYGWAPPGKFDRQLDWPVASNRLHPEFVRD